MSYLLLHLFLSFHSVQAQGPLNLYDLSLERMDLFSHVKTEQWKGKKTLWIGIQPNCQSCERQLQMIHCLPASVPVVVLGLWGEKKALETVWKRASREVTVLRATPKLVKKLDVKQTPTLWWVSKSGKIQKTYSFFTSCAFLENDWRQF